MPTPFGPKGPIEMTTMLAGPTPIVKNRFVKTGADGDHAVPATAASVNLGVAMDNQDIAEKTFPLAHKPGQTVLVEAGAAIAAGALITSDASGRGITAATTNPVSGINRDTNAVTTAGQLFVCELVQSAVIKAP